MEIRINAETAHKYSANKKYTYIPNTIEDIIDYIFINEIYPNISIGSNAAIYKHSTDVPTEVIEYFKNIGYKVSIDPLFDGEDKSVIYIYW